MTPQEKLNTVWPFPTAEQLAEQAETTAKTIPVITGARGSDYVNTFSINPQSDSLPIDWNTLLANTSTNSISYSNTSQKDSTTTVLDERAKNYGTFTGIGKLTQTFKEMLRAAPTWKNMQPDQRESLDMIVHKMARVLNGNCDYADSWVDIAGYARLVADRLETGQER